MKVVRRNGMLEQQQTNKQTKHAQQKGVFLGIPETNVGSLLCCGSYPLSFQSFLILTSFDYKSTPNVPANNGITTMSDCVLPQQPRLVMAQLTQKL